MKACKMCQGFGWYATERLPFFAPIDEDTPLLIASVKCPWCGMGEDDKNRIYQYLRETMKQMKGGKKRDESHNQRKRVIRTQNS